jgi:hypothetical protein
MPACYHHRMPISDTTPEIQAMQDRIIMGMTGEQRLKMALDLCQITHDLARAGIRSRHPDWSEKEVKREFIRLLFSPRTAPPGF